MSTDETKLPLRDRLAARLHELQCDRMKCDEQCKDDYEYEAADEIIAMFSTEQPEDAATDVHRYDSDSDMFADLDRHRAGLNETGQAEGTPCCHAGNIGHEGDCVNETVATFSTVHKWKVMFEDEQTLTLPAGSDIVSVDEQNQGIVLYAIVTDSPKRENVKIYVHGTGHPVNKGARRFIGTVKMHGGSLMFHVFEGERTDA